MSKSEEIIEKIEAEICELLNKKPLQPMDVDMLTKLTDSMKDVATASGMKEYVDAVIETDDGMSFAVKMPKVSYEHMHSMARGRSPITGRFVSRLGHPMEHYDRKYSGGYSGHSINDRMIASLEKLIDSAESDYEREEIRNEIESLRHR